jgi:hypothetical protein
VLDPQLDLARGCFPILGEELRNPHEPLCQVLVNHFLRLRPMSIAQAICIEAELLDLVQEKWVIGISLEHGAEVLKVARTLRG